MTNVFLSGSMRGGRRLLDTYKFMVDVILSSGADVLSQHVARDSIFEEEEGMSEEEIFMRDMAGIRKCDCLVAEVTVPSIGVGYEICRALSQAKPVLCVYEDGAKASAMVLGNYGVTATGYNSMEELSAIVRDFIIRSKETTRGGFEPPRSKRPQD